MKEKIFMSILAANAVIGLILCGAEAPTMGSQILISTFGLCLFAGAAWGVITIVREKDAGRQWKK